MRDDIKELLKRYDEIGALILEQKLDEFGDQLDQKNHGRVANSMLGVQQTLPWKMNASVFWISNTRRYTLQGRRNNERRWR